MPSRLVAPNVVLIEGLITPQDLVSTERAESPMKIDGQALTQVNSLLLAWLLQRRREDKSVVLINASVALQQFIALHNLQSILPTDARHNG